MSNDVTFEQHIRNIFELDKIPLQGNPQVVAEATEYRTAFLDKIGAGLLLFGEQGQLWLDDLYASFNMHTDAQWWLQKRTQFDSYDPYVLVQMFVLEDIAQMVREMGIKAQASVLKDTDTLSDLIL